MVVRFNCTCGMWHEADESRRGKRKRCPGCGRNLVIPVIKERRKNRPGMPRPDKLPRRRKVEQAIEFHVRLSGEFPTDRDEEELLPLGQPLTQAIEGAKLGEVWAEDYGGRKLVLTLLGPSADTMFDAIDPLLRRVGPMKRKGSRVVKLYDYGDPACKKATVRYS